MLLFSNLYIFVYNIAIQVQFNTSHTFSLLTFVEFHAVLDYILHKKVLNRPFKELLILINANRLFFFFFSLQTEKE